MDAKTAKEKLSEISYCDSMEPGHQIETVLLHPDDANEIIALIERLTSCLKFEQNYLSRVGTHAEGCYKWGPGHWDCAMQEIANRGRMIEKACELLSNTGCPGLEDVYCAENCNTEMNGSYCWLAWLEKEAEGEA